MARLNLATGKLTLSVLDLWLYRRGPLKALVPCSVHLLDLDLIKTIIPIFYLSMYLEFSVVPIQIIRDAFLTARSLVKRAQDFLRHQRAIEYINDPYSDSTKEELATGDLCIFCR